MIDQTQPATPCALRGAYTESSFIVYYRCNTEIANAAVQAQSLDFPIFKPGRHTWINPSFRSVLRQYRSACAQQQNPEHVIALHITREGWEQALKWDHSRMSGETPYARCRSDPELDIGSESLSFNFVQITLTPKAVNQGLNKWIVEIKDVTNAMKEIGELVDAGRLDEAAALLPQERPYEFLGSSE
jgi:Domain of unknown function (DUF4291)